MPRITNFNDLPKEWLITDPNDKRLDGIDKFYYRDIKDKLDKKLSYASDDEIIISINNNYIQLKHVLDTKSLDILYDNKYNIVHILNQTKEQQLYCCQSKSNDLFDYFNIKRDKDGKTIIDDDLFYEYFKYNSLITYDLYDLPKYMQLYMVNLDANNIKSIKFTDPDKIPDNDILLTVIKQDIKLFDYILSLIKDDNYIFDKKIQQIIAHKKLEYINKIKNLDEDIQIYIINRSPFWYTNIKNKSDKCIQLYNEKKENMICSSIYKGITCVKIDNNLSHLSIKNTKIKRKEELINQMQKLMDELKTLEE